TESDGVVGEGKRSAPAQDGETAGGGSYTGAALKGMQVLGTAGTAPATPGPEGGSQPTKSGELTQAMDVFSLGCVIAEVFLDGDVLLDLPALLQYHKSRARCGKDSEEYLNKIEKIQDPVLQKLVWHMTQRDPSARKSVMEYRKRMEEEDKPALFPKYFDGFLYDIMVQIHTSAPTPDER
ncbi:unnamed protein product, partial [Chrysoparadoxa australica]